MSMPQLPDGLADLLVLHLTEPRVKIVTKAHRDPLGHDSVQ